MPFIYNVTIADAQAELANPSASEISRKLCQEFLDKQTLSWALSNEEYDWKRFECKTNFGYRIGSVYYPLKGVTDKFSAYVLYNDFQESEYFDSLQDGIDWVSKTLTKYNFLVIPAALPKD